MAYNQYARYSGNPYESEGGDGAYGQSNPYGASTGGGYGASNPYTQDSYGDQVCLVSLSNLSLAPECSS